ncbi:MAG: hypothetical protein B7Y85_08010 [Brevundimonas sp. 32-68-21]|nr:MAG: hypothetical protein B7Y85_08010 [Brevundimonas sp. 32-68-21]
MAKQTKAQKARTGVTQDLLPFTDAIKLAKENAKSKFDESLEIAVNLGVDPRHADQQVRGVVNLPSGTGRDVRVAVFAKDAKAAEATAAGAEHVGVSFTQDALEANVKAIVDALVRSKPAGAKGTYVKRISLSSTMGPGFKVDPASLGA